MEYMRIEELTEGDFDSIITNAGGSRFSDDHSRELVKNTDYVLGTSIIELKLIDEEGLEKDERQRKLADVFRSNFPDRPVIALRPDLLDYEGQRAYYKAMVRPIKTHVEKANKQLKKSAEVMGGNPCRVLMLVNNGYSSLSHQEFMQLATRRACNDTHNIDAVVIAGHYYCSDTFDSYFFPIIDIFPIRIDRPFTDYEKLHREWNIFSEKHLTSNLIFGEQTHKEQRCPVQELTYDLDGVTYVKPAPPMGGLSTFFENGPPRQNSSNITTCPPVAQTYPDLDATTWQRFKNLLPTEPFFRNTHIDWVHHRKSLEKHGGQILKPFVPVTVTFDGCSQWCERNNRIVDTQALCDYANSIFTSEVRTVLDHAQKYGDLPILIPRYILLVTEVIGRDKANDLSSIYLVSIDMAGESSRPLLRNHRVFFEHGLAVASAYAVKHGVDIVRYRTDNTNS